MLPSKSKWGTYNCPILAFKKAWGHKVHRESGQRCTIPAPTIPTPTQSTPDLSILSGKGWVHLDTPSNFPTQCRLGVEWLHPAYTGILGAGPCVCERTYVHCPYTLFALVHSLECLERAGVRSWSIHLCLWRNSRQELTSFKQAIEFHDPKWLLKLQEPKAFQVSLNRFSTFSEALTGKSGLLIEIHPPHFL